MKLKQFMDENTITSIGVAGQVIITANTGTNTTGLNVDTSSLVGGTPVIDITEYSVADDILTVNGLTLNVDETEMLG